MADCMVKFLSPGFPHTFTKKYHQDLKMGYTDASQHQLQYVMKKNGSKLIFLKTKIQQLKFPAECV
jgi:hypothetical protein